MTIYYVATLAHYVLIEADDEALARSWGRAALYMLHGDPCTRWCKKAPIEIRTVRPATPDEIDLWNSHQQMLAKEGKR